MVAMQQKPFAQVECILKACQNTGFQVPEFKLGHVTGYIVSFGINFLSITCCIEYVMLDIKELVLQVGTMMVMTSLFHLSYNKLVERYSTFSVFFKLFNLLKFFWESLNPTSISITV